MGMLGALAGFGQGLQDYSKVLQKKQEQDWLDQQARVKYEREQNLEALRMRNQREMQSENLAAQGKWRAEDLGLKRQEMETNELMKMKQLGLQEKELESQSMNRQQALDIQRQQLAQQGVLQSAQVGKLEEETRQSKEAYDMKMDFFNKLPDEQKAAMVLGKQANKLSEAEIKIAGEIANEQYSLLMDDANKDQRKVLVSKLAKNFGISNTEAEIRLPEFLYAQTATSMLKERSPGSQSTKGKFDPKTDLPILKSMPATQQEAFLQKLQAADPTQASKVREALMMDKPMKSH